MGAKNLGYHLLGILGALIFALLIVFVTTQKAHASSHLGVNLNDSSKGTPSWSGAITFTAEEKEQHLKTLPELIQASNECMNSALSEEEHGYILKKYGIFRLYGDNSKFGDIKTQVGQLESVIQLLLSREIIKRLQKETSGDDVAVNKAVEKEMAPKLPAIKQFAAAVMSGRKITSAAVNEIADQLKAKFKLDSAADITELVTGRHRLISESCVGFVMTCLGQGFRHANQEDLWNKVVAFTNKNGVEGTALEHGLQALGWRTLFWNPDTSQNRKWDADEFAKVGRLDPDKFRGYHEYIWNLIQADVRLKRPAYYYLNRVDDWTTLVNFKTSPPATFTRIPLFVGLAHLGHHVFMGHDGKLVEAHNDFEPSNAFTVDTDAYYPIEERIFNPLDKGDYNADDYDDGRPLRPYNEANLVYPLHGGPRGAFFSGLIAVPPGY